MAYDSEQEQKFVYEAIVGIAAVCDGAREKDNQGFDGGDTKWGKGIASVPADDWTSEDVAEAARLLNKYSRQGTSVLGFDPRDLDIVQAHAEDETHYESREHSRQARRRAAASDIIRERKAYLVTRGINGPVVGIQLQWNKKDPDFGDILNAVRALPNRSFDFNTKTWTVRSITPELCSLIEEFDLDANFEVREVAAKAQAEKLHIYVQGGVVLLSTSKAEAFRSIAKGEYQGITTKDAFKAYGFRWNGEIWSLAADQVTNELLEIAADADLRVSDEVKALAQEGQKAAEEVTSLQGLLALASRAKDISELPEAFQAKVREVLGR